MLGTDKCKIQVLYGAPRMQQLSSNVKDGAWLVGGLRYMTTAVFLATPRVLSGQVPSRGPEIQPPGTTPRTSPPTTLQRPPPPPYHNHATQNAICTTGGLSQFSWLR